MIKINFYRQDNHSIKVVEVSGHAGFAEYGEDIVCAAVSSQVISIENSLTQLLGIDVQTEVNEVDGGYLKMTLSDISNKQLEHDAQVLLNHLYFAMEVLSENYPEFIKITLKSYQP